MVERHIDFGIESASYIYEVESIGIGENTGIIPFGTASLTDYCACLGVDANGNPITRTTDFRCQTVYIWTYWQGNITVGDTVNFKWYRNLRMAPAIDNWILRAEGSYSATGNWTWMWCSSVWDYPKKEIGPWKVDIYYNGVYKATVYFTIYVIQGDIIQTSITMKNTGLLTETFHARSQYWGPSVTEDWGWSVDTSASIAPGNTWNTNPLYTIPATMSSGFWRNIKCIVTDSAGNILDQRLYYSIIYKK